MTDFQLTDKEIATLKMAHRKGFFRCRTKYKEEYALPPHRKIPPLRKRLNGIPKREMYKTVTKCDRGNEKFWTNVKKAKKHRSTG